MKISERQILGPVVKKVSVAREALLTWYLFMYVCIYGSDSLNVAFADFKAFD